MTITLTAQAQTSLRKVARLHPSPVYLVGGTIRDAGLKKPLTDLDLATCGALSLARAVARYFRGTFVTLDEKNAVYRIVLPRTPGSTLKHIDVAEILGRDIREDLARRDFTVNAVALALSPDLPASIAAADFLDPRGGLKDLERKVLRVENDQPLKDDPLRLLRAFRIAAQAGLKIESATMTLIGKHRRLVKQPAGERIQSEILALLAVNDASTWLAKMDECGLLTALFEELEPARLCAESYYGTGGVLKHSLTVCARVDFLLSHFETLYPDLSSSFESHLTEKSSSEVPRRAVIMLAALLHDIAKPKTAKIVEGRLRFFDHDGRGAELAAKILGRLRFSREHIDAISGITRHHLRPGHLASAPELTEKAAYRFFRDLGDLAPELLAVCWGDHASYLAEPRLMRALATACGSAPGSLDHIKPAEARKTIHHLQIVSLLLRRYFDKERAPVPVRLLDGFAVMKALKLTPGPKIGEILERLREAQAEGKVTNRKGAIAFIQKLKLPLMALTAAFFATAGAFAYPSITPETLQCDGTTYRPGGQTHHPNPKIQTIVQDNIGLRIGQARMGFTANPNANLMALWRFDNQVNVTSACVQMLGIANFTAYYYQYNDPNGSPSMTVGQCLYSGCSDGPIWFSSPQVPLGPNVTDCPKNSFPTLGNTSSFISSQFGNAAKLSTGTFNQVNFGSVTYQSGTWDPPASYTLSAWVMLFSTGTADNSSQRILSEQNGNSIFWGFGLSDKNGLRLFDSRNTSNPDKIETTSVDFTSGWHKVDVVRNNSVDERFFVDGQFVGSIPAISTDSFASHPISHPVMIGMREGNTEFFNGEIDELRVLYTALSDEDIRLEYQGSSTHKFASGGLSQPYQNVNDSLLPGSNATTAAQIDPIQDSAASAITVNTAPGDRWIFEAQSTNTLTTILSTFTVTIDQSPPSPPQSLSGTPTATTSVNWSWSAPSTFCQVVYGGVNPAYQLFDAKSGSAIGGPVLYNGTSVSETVQNGTVNQLLARGLNFTDYWGTSLKASATAYTWAAVPSALSFSGTAISTGGFVASWSNNQNPNYTRYELNYSPDINFGVSVSTPFGIGNNFTGASAGASNLNPGTTYYVRVRAFNGQSSDFYGGTPTAFANSSVLTVPPAPALSGTPVSNSAIAWSWNSVSGASAYTLYDSPTQIPLTGSGFSSLSFTSSTLSANARYDAEVEAEAPSPTPHSAHWHAFTYTLANPPTGAAVPAVYTTSATFSWTSNANPAGTYYQVLLSTDPAYSVVIATLTSTSTSLTATGLFPNVTYYAEVEAINGVQIPTSFTPTLTAVTNPDPEITVSSSPNSPYIAPAGLVGAWQFDEGAGTTTADTSGNGNTANFGCTLAACVSTPTWTAGPPGMGNAASFSGLPGGAVLTKSGFSFAGSLTVEAWVNPTVIAQTANAGIVGLGSKNTESFALDVSPSGKFEFLTSNGTTEVSAATTTTIAAGQWTYVVGVYDSVAQAAMLYLNGALALTAALAPPRTISTGLLSIGNRQDASGNYSLPFNGTIDSVRVISQALTPAQVKSDYLGSFVSSVTAPAPNTGVIVGLAPNAFGAPAQIFISADPVNHPLKISPASLSAGLAATPAGLTMVPNSLIEVVPVIHGTPFTTTLGSSATVTIPYNDPSGTGLISGTNPPLTAAGIRMYTLNTAVNVWTAMPTTVDTVGHAASGITSHFSVFALFAPSTVASSLSAVRVYPVPWKPGSGGRFDATGVTFANLPVSGTIRILTLSGQRVRDLSFNSLSAGTFVWDGRNDAGRRTASGVYLAKITSVDGTTQMVKFAIER